MSKIYFSKSEMKVPVHPTSVERSFPGLQIAILLCSDMMERRDQDLVSSYKGTKDVPYTKDDSTPMISSKPNYL